MSVAVPVAELQAAWQRPVLAFLLLGGLAVFGAVGLAVRLAQRIARPVTEAARGAATVIRGQTPALSPSGIAEVSVFRDALADGAATVRTAMVAREQATVALCRAIETLGQRAAQLQTLSSELVLAEQRERHRLGQVLHDGLQIRVADQGKGFQPDQLGAAGSSGLGLLSIRQRLEYLGGTQEIASAPGQGSRFTLTLPLRALS